MDDMMKAGLAAQAAAIGGSEPGRTMIRAFTEIFGPQVLADAVKSGLSPQEVAVIPEAMFRAQPCILEQEGTLTFGDRSIDVTVRAYGKWVRAYSGVTERGERPSSPPEPAGFDVHSVTIQAGAAEEEIYNALGEKELEELADAAYEENA